MVKIGTGTLTDGAGRFDRQNCERLAREIGRFVQALRTRQLLKTPGVAETIDWAQALVRLHRERLDVETVEHTLGCILKDRHDLSDVGGEALETLVAEAAALG